MRKKNTLIKWRFFIFFTGNWAINFWCQNWNGKVISLHTKRMSTKQLHLGAIVHLNMHSVSQSVSNKAPNKNEILSKSSFTLAILVLDQSHKFSLENSCVSSHNCKAMASCANALYRNQIFAYICTANIKMKGINQWNHWRTPHTMREMYRKRKKQQQAVNCLCLATRYMHNFDEIKTVQ